MTGLSPPAGPFVIAGAGALGGSLARALRGRLTGVRIHGVDRSPKDLEAAVAAGAVDLAFDDLAEALQGARWLLIATPLGAESAVLRESAPGLEPDAVVIDVGSLQAPALHAAQAAGVTERFVACHPMAGTEASGFAASRADLFQDARIWLSASGEVGAPVRSRVAAFWEALGGRPEWVAADAHDRRMVAVSHLPQLAANALARVLAEAGVEPADLGPGGRDMTRLAASSPDLWRDLLEHSGAEAAELADGLAEELRRLAIWLRMPDLEAVAARMAETRAWRSG